MALTEREKIAIEQSQTMFELATQMRKSGGLVAAFGDIVAEYSDRLLRESTNSRQRERQERKIVAMSDAHADDKAWRNKAKRA